MKIILTKQEMFYSGVAGLSRQLESVINNRSPRFSEKYSGELLGYHVYGAMAEMVVCKAFGWYWDYSMNTFHVSDVPGKNIDVRFSRMNTLKIRPDDNNIIVVSVSGYMPNFKINGWMYSEDGKRPQWERDYNNQGKPAYFVPHEELLNPYDLKDVV